MKNTFAASFFFFIAFIVSCSAQNQRFNVAEFEKGLSAEETVLIDIRTPQEFQNGHLKNAININFYSPDFSNKMNEIGKNKHVLIYCASGNRSGQALQKLSKNNFQSFADLRGGVGAWIAEGKEVIR